MEAHTQTSQVLASPSQPEPPPAAYSLGENKQDATEAKQARKSEIERRCGELEDPISSNVLQHMDLFRACQVPAPITDDAWEVLKPQLLARRDAAQQIEIRCQNLAAFQAKIKNEEPWPLHRSPYILNPYIPLPLTGQTGSLNVQAPMYQSSQPNFNAPRYQAHARPSSDQYSAYTWAGQSASSVSSLQTTAAYYVPLPAESWLDQRFLSQSGQTPAVYGLGIPELPQASSKHSDHDSTYYSALSISAPSVTSPRLSNTDPSQDLLGLEHGFLSGLPTGHLSLLDSSDWDPHGMLDVPQYSSKCPSNGIAEPGLNRGAATANSSERSGRSRLEMTRSIIPDTSRKPLVQGNDRFLLSETQKNQVAIQLTKIIAIVLRKSGLFLVQTSKEKLFSERLQNLVKKYADGGGSGCEGDASTCEV